jgi:hypothetical protein
MGCGCKSKTNESAQSSTSSSSQVQENLKDKIKKTVEKYYTAQKTKG